MLMLPLSVITVIVAAALLLAVATGRVTEPDAASAQRVALQWSGAELADAPRRDGDGWEVDVRRADGSLVEIKLGPRLELRELDEERSAGGAAAHDEVTGLLRTRAIDAARAVSGPGTARSVERERDGSIEVDVVAKDRSIVEVELDSELRVTDIDEEDLYDE
jgi:hypothetical protein